MLEHIKTYFKYGNRFCGIEHASQNGKDIYFITQLKKNKNSLDLENTYEELSIEKVISTLPKKQHISLIINDDNVLTKQIKSLEVDGLKLVYKVFSNINLDDFYYEIIKQHNNQFVSICRKVYVDDLIDKYKKHGFSLIDITLGNAIISGISDFLKSEEITPSNANILFENQTITTIEKTEIENTTNYNVNGLEITNNYLLSCSGALNTLIKTYNPTTNFDELKTSLKYDYVQSRFYTLSLKSGLVLILTILLINFFIFNHYFNEVKTLEQTSQVNQTTKQKIIKLSENVSKSQKMVEDMLKSSVSKSSFFINAIVNSLPKSILLSEINYQPLTKNIKKDKDIELKESTIVISGTSNNSKTYSEWITHLESLKWINKVEVENYSDSKYTSNFSVKIKLTNDQ